MWIHIRSRSRKIKTITYKLENGQWSLVVVVAFFPPLIAMKSLRLYLEFRSVAGCHSGSLRVVGMDTVRRIGSYSEASE